MTDAYIIYSLLLVLMMISTWVYSNTPKEYRPMILCIALLVYSVVLGLRYNVGVDYLNYQYIYTHQDFSEVESGYALINRVLFNLGFSFPSIFIVVAFFQIFFFIKGVESISPKYLPLAIFFYFTTLYLFLSLNVLRQTLTFSIFVFSIRYISNRQFVKYAITILLASTIHKSALVLFPFYFLLTSDWLLRRRLLQIVGYIVTFVLSITLSDYIWSNFEVLARMSGYADYADSINTISKIRWADEDGIGMYLWMFVDLMVMIFYTKLHKLGLSKNEVVCYNLYYIGLLLTNIIAGTYFDRVNIYFQNFRIIIYAVFFYNILCRRSKIGYKVVAVAVIMVLVVFFYMGIFNKASMCAPYQFVSF